MSEVATEAAAAPVETLFSKTGEQGQQQQQQQQESAKPTAIIGGDGNFVENWHTFLPEDLGEARDGFKKFKSPIELARSYHGLERNQGRQKDAIYVPGEKSTPEEAKAFRERLGIPESPDKYAVKPDQLPEGVEWDDENIKPVLEIAHKHNVSNAALRELTAWQVQNAHAQAMSAQQETRRDLDEGRVSLKEAWGENYDKNLALAQRGAQSAGVDPLSRGFTDPAVVKGFARLAAMISEDKLVSQSGESGAQNGQQRAKDIMTNKENPMWSLYQQGDPETVDLVRSLLKQS